MCGIIAYIGHRQALEILTTGLQRLEYRGYDSAGVGLINQRAGDAKEHELRIVKKIGKVVNLKNAAAGQDFNASLGIAHTRWATHGPPSDANSHPHASNTKSVAVVHNGIIENYLALKEDLQRKGYMFNSETDTEVLAHLVHDVRTSLPADTPLDVVVRTALSQVTGAYGVCFVFPDQPDLLIGARMGSPLILGVSDGEYFLASDGSAVVEHTKDVVYLREKEMVMITRSGYEVSSLESGEKVEQVVHKLELELGEIEKGGYKHFMLKEIFEQPRVIENCMRGRVQRGRAEIRLGGIMGVMERLSKARRFIICACGTSFHAGLVGEYLIESLARINVEVEYASEFRYRTPILFEDDVVIAISQSGETADTLAAVREAQRQGAMAIGLVNAVGTSIARETDAGVYLHVGPEIGVASTKAFTGQVTVLTMLALQLGHYRGTISDEQMLKYVDELASIPENMGRVLEQSDKVFDISRSFRFAESFLYLGRGMNFPVALEGALKLKEISYIHAEGYAAAEMKHGPIALIDKHMPVVMICPKSDPTYDKIRANLQEVLARGGCCIGVTEEGNHDLDEECESVLYVPKTEEFLMPLLTVVPLQLLSYYIADLRKCNVDQPRNLAKSVTVE